MDLRLQQLPPGARALRVLACDLPLVSRALTMALRGRACTQALISRGTHYMLIKGESCCVSILEEDWLLIRPFLADGTFDPMTIPVGPSVDIRQDPLYLRVLSTLTPVFKDDFPHG